MKTVKITSLALLTGLAITSCQDDDNGKSVNRKIDFSYESTTPPLVTAMPGFENLEITSLISSTDQLAQSPTFVYGAQPDGAGFMKDPNGTGYLMITNHEILKSVSRVTFDENIVDGVGGITRLCSATLATPELHGFGPIFLTAGESGEESLVHGINPFSPSSEKSRQDRVLPALGRASMENAVPLTKRAYPNKTFFMIRRPP